MHFLSHSLSPNALPEPYPKCWNICMTQSPRHILRHSLRYFPWHSLSHSLTPRYFLSWTWLASYHPISNAKYLPITALLNAKGSLSCHPHSLSHFPRHFSRNSLHQFLTISQAIRHFLGHFPSHKAFPKAFPELEAPHHPITNVKFPPNSLLIIKVPRAPLHPVPKSYGHPNSINEPAKTHLKGQ